MSTYFHKVKCMKCGLHFAVVSKHERQGLLICPECGSVGQDFLTPSTGMAGQIRWLEKIDDPAFEAREFILAGAPVATTQSNTLQARVETPAEEQYHTYIHKAFCQNCLGSFVAYSWEPVKEKLYCPLCGAQDRQQRCLEISDKMIFAFVPGLAGELPHELMQQTEL